MIERASRHVGRMTHSLAVGTRFRRDARSAANCIEDFKFLGSQVLCGFGRFNSCMCRVVILNWNMET